MHVRAQWPTCPHLAHLVRAIKLSLVHIFGRAVLNLETVVTVAFRSVIALSGGFPDLPLPLPAPLAAGGRFLKKPRLNVFLCRYWRTCP